MPSAERIHDAAQTPLLDPSVARPNDRPEFGMRFPATVTAVITTLALLTGCLQSGPQDATATRPFPSPGSGPWDRRDMAVYREAMVRLERYEMRHQRFLAAGKATRAAKVFYQHRLRDWETSFSRLRLNEAEGIRIARAPVVISTEPYSIQSFQDGAADVVVLRCLDQSELGVTKNGDPLEVVHGQPVLQKVDIRRYENRTWRIGTFETTDTSCAR
jgi:hypothetical protein